MALVVEDGTGLENADAYLSVADADAYLASIGNPGSWSTQTNDAKEVAIRKATAWIDNDNRGFWKGQKGSADQSLAWPRSGVQDEEGYALATDEVPARLEKATAEAAWRFLTEDLDSDLDGGGAAVSKTRDKVGPLETEVEYAGSAVIGDKERRKIDSLLEGLVYPPNFMDRG